MGLVIFVYYDFYYMYMDIILFYFIFDINAFLVS